MPCARTSAPRRPGAKKRFANSVIAVKDVNGLTILGPGRDDPSPTDMQALAGLKASFAQMAEMGGFGAVATAAHPDVEAVNHVHHAGNSSGIVDGAAAVLIGLEEGRQGAGREAPRPPSGLCHHRLRSRPHADGPVDVTRLVLKKAGMTTKDIDLFELNEAFSPVVLRFQQAFDIDDAVLNVNGGAIAMGHPLGATGAMILGTVLDELERTASRPRW